MYIVVAEVLLEPVRREREREFRSVANSYTEHCHYHCHHSHFTEVHIEMVGQSLAHEGNTRKTLRVDLHQRPEETHVDII